eukprot:5213289-Alexandrium_andersonii.AAC.1
MLGAADASPCSLLCGLDSLLGRLVGRPGACSENNAEVKLSVASQFAGDCRCRLFWPDVLQHAALLT